MKKQISLKLFVTLAFFLLIVVLVAGYSLLSAHYYRMGMRSVTAVNMEEVARSYQGLGPPTTGPQLEEYMHYRIFKDWNQVPTELRDLFGTELPEPGLTIKGTHSHWYRPPDSIYFVYLYQNKNNTLFVTRKGSRATAPPLIGRNVAESRKLLLGISASIIGLLGITILLLLRSVSRPAASLGQWARSLSAENLKEPPPDFSYPELNDLAQLIRTSLSSVQESLDREHSFLRHASHELRTPITIMRNNVELFNKIKESNNPERSVQQAKVMDRIDRASLNMQYLTETLLWLSRQEMQTLPCKKIELDTLVEELVKEMKYLLDRKDVELKIETNQCSVVLPEFPVRIVVGNLIRNAFQHTWEGCITIHQQANHIVISNPQRPLDKGPDELGFGLGLELTTKLTQKLNWEYVDSSTSNTRQVSVTLGNGHDNLYPPLSNDLGM